MNFVVGHMRSGTAFMAHLLNASPEAHAHWEGLFRLTCFMIDPVSIAYYEGRATSEDVRALLRCYNLSKKPISIDSYYRLPWIIPPLLAEFPDAKIIHIVRDPRNQVTGAYNDVDAYGDALLTPQGQMKFMRWCVENDPTGNPDAATSSLKGGPATFHAIMQRRRAHPRIPHAQWDTLTRFEKTCLYWTEANRLCVDGMASRPKQYLRVRLEDMNTVEASRRVFDFLQIQAPADEVLKATMAKKVNTAAADDPYWIAVRSIKKESGAEILPAYSDWPQAYKDTLRNLCGELGRELGYDL